MFARGHSQRRIDSLKIQAALKTTNPESRATRPLKNRGVGEVSEAQDLPANRADDKVRTAHLMPRNRSDRMSGRFKPQSRRRLPSPTPASPQPTASRSRAWQSCWRCRRSNRCVADWLGADRPDAYLLLLLRYLALCRSFLLRGGLRLCLLHHAALLAKSLGGCRISTYANRKRCTSITTAQQKKQLPH